MTENDVANSRPTIRASGLKDLSEVQALYRKMTEESHDPLSALQANEAMVDWQLKRLRQELLAEQRYICAIAEIDGQIIGYAAGVVVSRGDVFVIETTGLLAEVYVEVEWRRRKVACQLIEMVMAGFTDRGIHWIEASVPQGVSSAEALADHLGFRQNTRTFLMNLVENTAE